MASDRKKYCKRQENKGKWQDKYVVRGYWKVAGKCGKCQENYYKRQENNGKWQEKYGK